MLPAIFKSLAWDVDPSGIDLQEHRDWLIARVLTYGSLAQVYELERIVGREALKQFFWEGGIDRVDRQTSAFWLVLLGISKEACKRRPSTQNNWKF